MTINWPCAKCGKRNLSHWEDCAACGAAKPLPPPEPEPSNEPFGRE